MSYTSLVKTLVDSLKLAHAPIGVAYLETPPEGVPHCSEVVPAACAFWKAAESSLFFATAEDHYNCPIGAMTQGFNLPKPVMDEAMSLVGRMGKLSYLEAAEAGNVPMVKKVHAVVVYGPLAAFEDIPVDLALLISTPFQAMLISEASGVVAWKGQAPAAALGRPACAVVPAALDSGSATLSVACTGARTFAGIRESEMLVAIPGPALADLESRLPILLGANLAMKEYYDSRKAQFGAA